jgi:hypothetical protein
MACLRLLTLLPLRPLLSVPFLRFFMARSTYLEAPLEYLRAILFLLNRQSLRPLQMCRPMRVTIVYGPLFRELGA